MRTHAEKNVESGERLKSPPHVSKAKGITVIVTDGEAICEDPKGAEFQPAAP